MQSKTFICLETTVVLLAFCTTVCQAELLLYEPFNYSGTSLDGQGGSELGLTGTWDDNVSGASGAVGTAGPVSLSNDDTSLSHPGLIASLGARVADTGAGTARRSLDGFSINLATGGQTYYISALFRGETLLQFEGTHTDNVNYTRAMTGINSSGQFLVGSFGTSTSTSSTYSGGSYSSDETYLLVARIQTNATTDGKDTFALKVYDTSMAIDSSEPASFDLQATNASSVDLTRMFLGRTDDNGEIDEIRIGTTWNDVTPQTIPEPSTWLLLVVGAVGLLPVAIRRRHLLSIRR